MSPRRLSIFLPGTDVCLTLPEQAREQGVFARISHRLALRLRSTQGHTLRWVESVSASRFGCQNRVPMPRKKKHVKSAQANGMTSGTATRVSQQEREELAAMPELTVATLSSATVFSPIERAETVRENRRIAKSGWQYVMDNFHTIPLVHVEGNYSRSTRDYGGLRSRITFEKGSPDGLPYGLKFMGTKSYDKKGVSKRTLGSSTQPYATFLQHLFLSAAATPGMVLINPRMGAMRGLTSGFHTDANTRGAHPNAMRCLESWMREEVSSWTSEFPFAVLWLFGGAQQFFHWI